MPLPEPSASALSGGGLPEPTASGFAALPDPVIKYNATQTAFPEYYPGTSIFTPSGQNYEGYADTAMAQAAAEERAALLEKLGLPPDSESTSTLAQAMAQNQAALTQRAYADLPGTQAMSFDYTGETPPDQGFFDHLKSFVGDVLEFDPVRIGLKVLSVFARPGQIIPEVVADEESDPWYTDVMEALSGRSTASYSDVLAEAGWEPGWGRGLTGLAMDVALDPLTYVMMGGGGVSRVLQAMAGSETLAATKAVGFLSKMNADDVARVGADLGVDLSKGLTAETTTQLRDALVREFRDIPTDLQKLGYKTYNEFSEAVKAGQDVSMYTDLTPGRRALYRGLQGDTAIARYGPGDTVTNFYRDVAGTYDWAYRHISSGGGLWVAPELTYTTGETLTPLAGRTLLEETRAALMRGDEWMSVGAKAQGELHGLPASYLLGTESAKAGGRAGWAYQQALAGAAGGGLRLRVAIPFTSFRLMSKPVVPRIGFGFARDWFAGESAITKMTKLWNSPNGRALFVTADGSPATLANAIDTYLGLVAPGSRVGGLNVVGTKFPELDKLMRISDHSLSSLHYRISEEVGRWTSHITPTAARFRGGSFLANYNYDARRAAVSAAETFVEKQGGRIAQQILEEYPHLEDGDVRWGHTVALINENGGVMRTGLDHRAVLDVPLEYQQNPEALIALETTDEGRAAAQEWVADILAAREEMVNTLGKDAADKRILGLQRVQAQLDGEHYDAALSFGIRIGYYGKDYQPTISIRDLEDTDFDRSLDMYMRMRNKKGVYLRVDTDSAADYNNITDASSTLNPETSTLGVQVFDSGNIRVALREGDIFYPTPSQVQELRRQAESMAKDMADDIEKGDAALRAFAERAKVTLPAGPVDAKDERIIQAYMQVLVQGMGKDAIVLEDSGKFTMTVLNPSLLHIVDDTLEATPTMKAYYPNRWSEALRSMIDGQTHGQHATGSQTIQAMMERIIPGRTYKEYLDNLVRYLTADDVEMRKIAQEWSLDSVPAALQMPKDQMERMLDLTLAGDKRGLLNVDINEGMVSYTKDLSEKIKHSVYANRFIRNTNLASNTPGADHVLARADMIPRTQAQSQAVIDALAGLDDAMLKAAPKLQKVHEEIRKGVLSFYDSIDSLLAQAEDTIANPLYVARRWGGEVADDDFFTYRIVSQGKRSLRMERASDGNWWAGFARTLDVASPKSFHRPLLTSQHVTKTHRFITTVAGHRLGITVSAASRLDNMAMSSVEDFKKALARVDVYRPVYTDDHIFEGWQHHSVGLDFNDYLNTTKWDGYSDDGVVFDIFRSPEDTRLGLLDIGSKDVLYDAFKGVYRVDRARLAWRLPPEFPDDGIHRVDVEAHATAMAPEDSAIQEAQLIHLSNVTNIDGDEGLIWLDKGYWVDARDPERATRYADIVSGDIELDPTVNGILLPEDQVWLNPRGEPVVDLTAGIYEDQRRWVPSEAAASVETLPDEAQAAINSVRANGSSSKNWEWKPIVSGASMEGEVPSGSGLYVFGHYEGTEFIPHYPGKATAFKNRVPQHLQQVTATASGTTPIRGASKSQHLWMRGVTEVRFYQKPEGVSLEDFVRGVDDVGAAQYMRGAVDAAKDTFDRWEQGWAGVTHTRAPVTAVEGGGMWSVLDDTGTPYLRGLADSEDEALTALGDLDTSLASVRILPGPEGLGVPTYAGTFDDAVQHLTTNFFKYQVAGGQKALKDAGWVVDTSTVVPTLMLTSDEVTFRIVMPRSANDTFTLVTSGVAGGTQDYRSLAEAVFHASSVLDSLDAKAIRMWSPAIADTLQAELADLGIAFTPIQGTGSKLTAVDIWEHLEEVDTLYMNRSISQAARNGLAQYRTYVLDSLGGRWAQARTILENQSGLLGFTENMSDADKLGRGYAMDMMASALPVKMPASVRANRLEMVKEFIRRLTADTKLEVGDRYIDLYYPGATDEELAGALKAMKAMKVELESDTVKAFIASEDERVIDAIFGMLDLPEAGVHMSEKYLGINLTSEIRDMWRGMQEGMPVRKTTLSTASFMHRMEYDPTSGALDEARQLAVHPKFVSGAEDIWGPGNYLVPEFAKTLYAALNINFMLRPTDIAHTFVRRIEAQGGFLVATLRKDNKVSFGWVPFEDEDVLAQHLELLAPAKPKPPTVRVVLDQAKPVNASARVSKILRQFYAGLFPDGRLLPTQVRARGLTDVETQYGTEAVRKTAGHTFLDTYDDYYKNAGGLADTMFGVGTASMPRPANLVIDIPSDVERAALDAAIAEVEKVWTEGAYQVTTQIGDPAHLADLMNMVSFETMGRAGFTGLHEVTWADVDIPNSKLKLPRQKRGGGNWVPLSEETTSLLAATKGTAKDTDRVFPGVKQAVRLTLEDTWAKDGARQQLRKSAASRRGVHLQDVTVHAGGNASTNERFYALYNPFSTDITLSDIDYLTQQSRRADRFFAGNSVQLEAVRDAIRRQMTARTLEEGVEAEELTALENFLNVINTELAKTSSRNQAILRGQLEQTVQGTIRSMAEVDISADPLLNSLIHGNQKLGGKAKLLMRADMGLLRRKYIDAIFGIPEAERSVAQKRLLYTLLQIEEIYGHDPSLSITAGESVADIERLIARWTTENQPTAVLHLLQNGLEADPVVMQRVTDKTIELMAKEPMAVGPGYQRRVSAAGLTLGAEPLSRTSTAAHPELYYWNKAAHEVAKELVLENRAPLFDSRIQSLVSATGYRPEVSEILGGAGPQRTSRVYANIDEAPEGAQWVILRRRMAKGVDYEDVTESEILTPNGVSKSTVMSPLTQYYIEMMKANPEAEHWRIRLTQAHDERLVTQAAMSEFARNGIKFVINLDDTVHVGRFHVLSQIFADLGFGNPALGNKFTIDVAPDAENFDVLIRTLLNNGLLKATTSTGKFELVMDITRRGKVKPASSTLRVVDAEGFAIQDGMTLRSLQAIDEDIAKWSTLSQLSPLGEALKGLGDADLMKAMNALARNDAQTTTKKLQKIQKVYVAKVKRQERLNDGIARAFDAVNQAQLKLNDLEANVHEAVVFSDNPPVGMPGADFFTKVEIPGIRGNVWAHPYMAREFEELFKDLSPLGNNAIHIRYRKIMQGWKRLATMYWPGFHFRNFAGTVFNNMMGGVNETDYEMSFKLLTVARSFWKSGDDEGRKLAESLITEQDWKYLNLSKIFGDRGADFQMTYLDLLDFYQNLGIGTMNSRAVSDTYELYNRIKKDTERQASHNPLRRKLVQYEQQMYKLNESVESIGRFAAFSHGLAAFGEPWSARAFTMVRHGDYTDLTTMERGFIKDIMPFYKWLRTNLPYQFQMMLESPVWSQSILKLERALYEGNGLDYYKTQAHMPEWLRDAYTIPVKTGKGLQILTADIPLADLSTSTKDLFASQVPFIRPVLESMVFDKTLFSGRPLDGGAMVKMNDAFARIPLITDILAGLNVGYKGADGGYYLPAKWENLLTAVPVYSRSRDWILGDGTNTEARWGAFFSAILGISERPFTEADMTQQEKNYYYSTLLPSIKQLRALGVPLPEKSLIDPNMFEELGFNPPEPKSEFTTSEIEPGDGLKLLELTR